MAARLRSSGRCRQGITDRGVRDLDARRRHGPFTTRTVVADGRLPVVSQRIDETARNKCLPAFFYAAGAHNRVKGARAAELAVRLAVKARVAAV